MRKFRLTALIVLLCTALMVSACSSSAPEKTDNPVKKEPKPQGNTNSYTSAIFSRNVNYDSFVPCDNIKLPVDGEDILDAQQIGKSIYILARDGIYCLNIADGLSERIIELPNATDGENAPQLFMSSHGESIFVYSSETGEISEYSMDGSIAGSLNNEELRFDNVDSFAVTDSNFVVLWYKADDKGYLIHKISVFDRSSAELIDAYKAKPETNKLYPYKENKLLYTTTNLYSTNTAYDLCFFDAESGKTKLLRALSGIGDSCLIDIAYNPQTDTVLTFSDTYLWAQKSKPYVAEFSLSDDDNIIHKRFSFEPGGSCFMGVSENIVSVISADGSAIEYFDFLNPPRSITIAYNDFTRGWLAEIIDKFEAEHGILVRTTDYRRNMDVIDIKLMAGDSDFDLYCPVTYSLYKYIKTDMYGDLSVYPSLLSKLEGSRAAEVMAKTGDSYFGVPTSIEYRFERETSPEDSNFAFSKFATLGQYCADNIDTANMTYSDPEGEEFYKVLKYIYDNPLGNLKDMPYGDKYIDGEFRCLMSNYIMLNPASRSKDDAALFMEFVLDAYSGKIPALKDVVPQYLELDDGEYFADWSIMPMSIVDPLFTAKDKVPQTDGSKKEIKKLAKEAAAEVAMRIGE